MIDMNYVVATGGWIVAAAVALGAYARRELKLSELRETCAFGFHNFDPRYDEPLVEVSAGRWMNARRYIRDICIDCGKTVEAPTAVTADDLKKHITEAVSKSIPDQQSDDLAAGWKYVDNPEAAIATAQSIADAESAPCPTSRGTAE